MPFPARLNRFSAALICVALTNPSAVIAQASGVLVYSVIVPAGNFGSSAFTAVVVSGIAAARKFCGDMNDAAYRVDCLAERFGVVADGIPADSDYAGVRTVLRETSRKLADLARANRDRSRPAARVARSGGAAPEQTTRRLIPVSPQAAATVNRQATAILQETETLLLRSAENTSQMSQYSRIAKAVGSNKVLLRA
jgi:hypothetical protein